MTKFWQNQFNYPLMSSGWVQFIVACSICFLVGCEKETYLKDFQSDGCSLFPDRMEITREDWCECCFEHDIAYWKGGTEEERLLADLKLRDCIIESTGNKELADLMYQGVRVGGSPYFYNWYRWGYGWDFERKYKELSAEESALVASKLAKYYAEKVTSPCVEK